MRPCKTIQQLWLPDKEADGLTKAQCVGPWNLASKAAVNEEAISGQLSVNKDIMYYEQFFAKLDFCKKLFKSESI